MFRGARQVLHKRGESQEKTAAVSPPSILPILSAEVLLETERRQQLLKVLPSLSQLPSKEYQGLYLRLIHYFAEFVQQLPETKSGYFPYAGGLLDHGLERAVRALALSRNYITSEEQGDTKEALLKQAMLRYAVFTAALLYDLGRLTTKINVVICDADGRTVKPWYPYEGSMIGQGTHYKYEFDKGNWDYLRVMVTPLLARQLMSKASGLTHDKLISARDGFSWIAQDKEILETWFALFKEDVRQLSALLAIIPLADAQVIANYFDLERPLQELAQPTAGFWDKYGPALINQAEEAAKSQFVTSRHFSEREREHLQHATEETQKVETYREAERQKELLPEQKTWEGMDAQVAERKLATVPATLAAGLAFFRWLLKAMRDKQLTFNNPNSVLHRVNEGVLITTDAFKQFANSQTQYKDPAIIQKQFANLGFTLATGNNQSIFNYAVDRPGISQTREGMILRNPYLLGAKLPDVNKSLHLVGDVLKNFATSQIILTNLMKAGAPENTPNPPPTKPRSMF